MDPNDSSNSSSSQRLGGSAATDSRWEAWCHHRYRGFDGRHDRRRTHAIVLGLMVIAWGGLLLMREFGVIDPSLRLLDFWPLLLIACGLSAVVRRHNVGAILVGLVVAFIGAGLLAEKLGYVVTGVAHLWPLIIVAAGLAILLRGFTRHRLQTFANETVSADVLQRSVTMGSLKLVVDSQQFKGATLSATMGEVQVDLRRAAMSNEEVTIDVSLVMGGIELYVPSNWQVISDVSPLIGTVEDRTELRPDAAGVQKRLRLRGSITMGAVTIKN